MRYLLKQFFTITLIFLLFIPVNSFAALDNTTNSPTQIYDFFRLTDNYELPSSDVEKQLDILLETITTEEDRSKLIYRYIMYRDQKEIVNYFNPFDKTLFELDNNSILIDEIEDFAVIEQKYNELNELINALIPLKYEVIFVKDQIFIIDDYNYLLNKYGDQCQFEPYSYLKIMNLYHNSNYNLYSNSSTDIDIDELISLVSQCEKFMSKPYKDFAFENVKRIYSIVVPILYQEINTENKLLVHSKLNDAIPNSLLTTTLTEYFDLLDNTNDATQEMQVFITNAVDKQIHILTLK